MNIIRKQEKIRFYILPTLGVLFLVGIAALMVFPIAKKEVPNVTFHFNNHAVGLKKVSGLIKLNGNVIAKTSDFSQMKLLPLLLKNGKYKIEISEIDGSLKASDSFEIKTAEEKYIYATFSYQPDYKEYLPIYKMNYFSRYIEKQNYSKEAQSEIRKEIDQKVTLDYLKSTGYKPKKARFEIKIQDHPHKLD